MKASFAYPCTRSGEPRRLTATAIGARAAELRACLFGPAIRPVEVPVLVRRLPDIAVNDRTIRLVWDLDHPVEDDAGVPVLGVCEHDPAEPTTVMISLNAELLADEPLLMRSTAAHELAHALFDMPAALGAGARRTFRTTTHAAFFDQAPIDWPEWRADEFMGAFLVPIDRLARAVARQAGAQGLALRWGGAGAVARPKVTVAPDEPEFGWMIDALAETFGVSPAFMAVRLHKSGFVDQRGR